jgi:hypothetical protein
MASMSIMKRNMAVICGVWCSRDVTDMRSCGNDDMAVLVNGGSDVPVEWLY